MKELLVKTKKFKNLFEMFGIERGISLIAGPCSIESYEQMELIAQNLVKNNVHFVRGGAYKPRTSPYDFQGLGLDGLKILDDIRNKYNLLAVSEIMDIRDIESGIQYLDIIQIGSRNMNNYALLREVGRTNHPILLKRGMVSSISEFLLAAEYIVSEGNTNIILCERGIRTFETYTRNTLDIACIAAVKGETSLPIIADLSHSLGRTDIVFSIANAVKACGADGIMVEFCETPQAALSDANQHLDFNEFRKLAESLRSI